MIGTLAASTPPERLCLQSILPFTHSPIRPLANVASLRHTAVVCLLLFGVVMPAYGQAPDTLRIDAVVQQALSDNFRAQIARNQVDVATNNRSVGNAGFLPTVTGRAGYSETRTSSEQEFLDGNTQDVDGATSTNENASAELAWTLFDGLGRFATYDRLGAELDRQRAATQEQVEVVLADAVDTYYDAARQQQQLAVLRTGLALSRERLRIAQTRRDLGTASDLEVRQAQVDLNADSAAVLRQQSALVGAKAQLNAQLGRTRASTRYAVAEQIALDTTLAAATLRQTTTERNPVLKQAEQSLSVAQAEERELRADYFPSIDATVRYGYSELDSESGFLRTSTSTDLQYGLSLTWDLFDGLDRVRRSQNAQVRTRNAQLFVNDVQAQLEADLASAYENYRNRLQLVTLEQENLQAAVANVAVALEQFRQGTITSVELREVQEQRVQAESRLLDARFEAKRAETELLRLSGQLADTYR